MLDESDNCSSSSELVIDEIQELSECSFLLDYDHLEGKHRIRPPIIDSPLIQKKIKKKRLIKLS